MTAAPTLIRLVHLSDPHFGTENGDAVEAAAAAARALRPDLTIVSGDLTAEGRSQEFSAARDWLASLPQPQIVTPGNHDTPVWNLPQRLFWPFGRYRAYVGQPAAAGFLPGLTVRSLNTARGVQPRFDWSKGSIDLDAVRQAAKEMTVATKALKVFVCHHPLVEMTNAAVSGGVHRGLAAARLLAEQNIDLILSGHVHNPFSLALPWGDGKTYAVGAGTLSQRTRGTPACFLTIEAGPDTIRVAVQEWTGAGFEQGLVWALPRRRLGNYEKEEASLPLS
ncbi:metallophosphoesterase [Methylocella silvestris BL2]|uniref:Metallophosphoesterase n=1 Tax=Methylocella silvestris (strain DSM 15510 / CIP 108128 / LMG 27833 / NCIMB 13906 / BL2) TaxID=395965 RepID=B8EIE7_METSB|nr:metallophosphoesterase [Methylocella silvestris]ACK51266.1 metallophosphoesterase [Methylocella silvestris BL2]